MTKDEAPNERVDAALTAMKQLLDEYRAAPATLKSLRTFADIPADADLSIWPVASDKRDERSGSD